MDPFLQIFTRGVQRGAEAAMPQGAEAGLCACLDTLQDLLRAPRGVHLRAADVLALRDDVRREYALNASYANVFGVVFRHRATARFTPAQLRVVASVLLQLFAPAEAKVAAILGAGMRAPPDAPPPAAEKKRAGGDDDAPLPAAKKQRAGGGGLLQEH